MKTRYGKLITGFVLFWMFLGTAQAGQNGFGLYGGIASHSDAVVGGGPKYSSSGISLGLDYQMMIGQRFSLDFFLMSSYETTAGNPPPGYDTAGHGILGVSARFWFGNFFFGPHIGSYSEVLYDPSLNTISGANPGAGISFGMEWPSGLFFMGQVDNILSLPMDGAFIYDVDVRAFRMQVGYRF